MSTGTLTDLEQKILDFERDNPHWKYIGAKEDEIRRRFDLSTVRYHQILNTMLDAGPAELEDPSTVRRLRALRTRRGAHRAGRTVMR